MAKIIFSLLLFSLGAFGQDSGKVQAEKFKKESATVERAINAAAEQIVPGIGVVQSAKGTYLEGYGAVFTLQMMLEPTRNPFSGLKSPAEVRSSVTQRRKDIQARLAGLLQERAAAMDSIGASGSVSIVLYLINSNPADMPDLPGQLVITVKKQDAVDFRDKKIADLSNRISVREY